MKPKMKLNSTRLASLSLSNSPILIVICFLPFVGVTKLNGMYFQSIFDNVICCLIDYLHSSVCVRIEVINKDLLKRLGI